MHSHHYWHPLIFRTSEGPAFRCLLDLGPLRSGNLLFKKQHKHWYRSKISKYLWWWVLHIKNYLKPTIDKTSFLGTNVLFQDSCLLERHCVLQFELSYNLSTNDSKLQLRLQSFAVIGWKIRQGPPVLFSGYEKQHKHRYRSKISKYLWLWVLHIKNYLKPTIEKTSFLGTNVLFRIVVCWKDITTCNLNLDRT